MADPAVHTEGLGIDPAVDQVRPLVRSHLRRLEQERDLRVVFACESGSRAWGFASSNSDFDVRFIFVRPAAQYLRLRPPADAFDIHGENDLDLAGWDIRKAAELMRKSNSPLLEWLDSPIVYEADGVVSGRLVKLRQRYFDAKKSVYHYLSLAGNVWDKYISGHPEPVRKKYLYALRPLACVRYINIHQRQPPTPFAAVLEGITLPVDVRDAMSTLITDKKADRELGAAPASGVLNQWIEQMIDDGRKLAETLPTSEVSNQELDSLIADAIINPGM